MKNTFTPLSDETRSIVSTKEAAFHLNRAEQTLRLWSHYKKGPIVPIHVGGRLAWKVSEIKMLVGL